MRQGAIVLTAMTALAVSVAAKEKDGGAAKHIAFPTQARVELGADGKVVAVTADPKLPASVGQAIRDTVGQWRFIAPARNGQPVGGVTYVRLYGCAAPVADGYQLAFESLGNGPDQTELRPPRFPSNLARNGHSAKFKVTYRIQVEGNATIESIGMLEGSKWAAPRFRKSIEEWMGASRFAPELVDGQPVATLMTMDVEYLAPDASGSRAGRDDRPATDEDRSSCQAVLGKAAKQDRAVALDSPFTMLPPG